MNRLVNKLLGRHINAWQLAGFVLANLLGMAIVLIAIQLSADIKPMMTANDSFMRPGQLVLTKKVNSMGIISGKSTAFSQKEIDDLRTQAFTKALGLYTPAQYEVFATIGGGSLPMKFSTDMFFESVDDDFLDVNPERWDYDPETAFVPIILPRTYLNLYNFGFASSQGLPTISESIIQSIPINLRLTGTDGVLLKTGRVVAFSRKINTILVPQQFMDDMNRRLSPNRTPEAARLIIRTDNPADERIVAYLNEHGYDTETDDADASRAASLMRLITSAVLLIGLLISALAFYVLLLSIFLLLQKHTEKIDNLLLIGYSPSMVARPFHLLTIALNLLVLIGAFLIVALARQYYLPLFGQLYSQFEPATFLPTLAVGIGLFLLVSLLNFLAIRRKVNAILHIHE